MKITYDPEVDVLYIKFRDGQCTTKEVGDGVVLDFDQRGIVGIEMLDFLKCHGDEQTLRHISFDTLEATTIKG